MNIERNQNKYALAGGKRMKHVDFCDFRDLMYQIFLMEIKSQY